jgi:iron complex outermembrane receptor protein
VRTPSRVEQDLDVTIGAGPSDPVFLRWLGNPAFQSETLRTAELGYRATLGERFSLDVSGFLSRYDKLLGLEAGTPFLEPGRLVIPVHSANALEADAAGVEVAFRVRPFERLDLQGDYSYLSLALDKRPGSESLTDGAGEEGSSPRHQARLRSVLSLSRRIEISAFLRVVDDLPAQPVPAYAELDARLSWAPSRALEFAVAGRNLLHDHHLEFLGDAPTPSEIERSILGTLRVRW